MMILLLLVSCVLVLAQDTSDSSAPTTMITVSSSISSMSDTTISTASSENDASSVFTSILDNDGLTDAASTSASSVTLTIGSAIEVYGAGIVLTTNQNGVTMPVGSFHFNQTLTALTSTPTDPVAISTTSTGPTSTSSEVDTSLVDSSILDNSSQTTSAPTSISTTTSSDLLPTDLATTFGDSEQTTPTLSVAPESSSAETAASDASADVTSSLTYALASASGLASSLGSGPTGYYPNATRPVGSPQDRSASDDAAKLNALFPTPSAWIVSSAASYVAPTATPATQPAIAPLIKQTAEVLLCGSKTCGADAKYGPCTRWTPTIGGNWTIDADEPGVMSYEISSLPPGSVLEFSQALSGSTDQCSSRMLRTGIALLPPTACMYFPVDDYPNAARCVRLVQAMPGE